MESVKSAIDDRDIESLGKLLMGKSSEFCGEALYWALKKGVDELEESVNSTEEEISSVNSRNKELVKLIMDFGADVNCCSIQEPPSRTVFAYACYKSTAEIVKMMLGAIHALNLEDKDQSMQLAFRSGCNEKIDLFLELAGITADDVNRLQLLQCFVLSKLEAKNLENLSYVSKLVQLGADVNSFVTPGVTLIMTAMYYKNFRVFECLLDNGASASDRSHWKTALFMGNVDIVKALMDRGRATYDGGSDGALHEVAQYGCVELAKLFLDLGANVNGRDGSLRNTPLEQAAAYGHVDVVELLLDRGAARSANSLRMAVAHDNVEVVKSMIDRGYDVNCLAVYNYTALCKAIENDNVEMVKLFLDNGARVNEMASTTTGSALHLAAENGNVEIAAILLDRGADINMAMSLQETPLMVAVTSNMGKMWRFLVGQVVLIKSLGLFVSRNNLQFVKRHKKLCDYGKECLWQIELLKIERIVDCDLSCLEFLKIADLRKLAGLARNENIYKFFASTEFEKKFPIYVQVVRRHFDKGTSRNRDFELIYQFTNYLSSREHDKLPMLPLTFVRQLFALLNDRDVSGVRRLSSNKRSNE